jgi:hypothetical protein
VSLWLAIILAALLALALAAVITSPRTDSPPAEGAGARPDLPGPAPGPPPSPLPRRVAGQCGVVAHPAGPRRDPAGPGVRRAALGAGAEATRHVVCPQAPGGLTRSGMRGRSRYARACAR